MTKNEFLARISIAATNDMKNSSILASLTIAQAILESGWGNSGLTQKGNNLFGIKGTYKGNSITMLTTEYFNGKPIKVNAKFRKYESWYQSIQDHSSLFNRLDRYKKLRGCKDYKLACKYVYEAGYATDPNYTSKLINIIETNNLYKYDYEYDNINKETTNNVIYKVKAGDTLNAIAKKFNTTVSTLVALNNIVDANKIYIGQELKMPY